MILQSNPKAGYLAHQSEIDAAIARVLQSGWYILGREVQEFEREFAAYLGVTDTVGVATGTDALLLALKALEIGPGDLVFTVSHTAGATATAIVLAGAQPVFVDIDPQSYTMDPNRLEDAVKHAFERKMGRPKAIVPVHLYGHPADMPAVLEIAERYDLRVIEDCAQAHGAAIGDKKTGTWGSVAAFSFYPTKNLGALGDGGAVVTNDPDIAARLRSLREYGWKERYVSDVSGYNSRLDEFQAGILRAKLPHLDTDNAQRRQLAQCYDQLLKNTDISLPTSAPDVTHVYHQYAIRTPKRDELRQFLKSMEIGSLIHYPVPVHQQPAFQIYAGETNLAQTERVAQEILSLPLYPELERTDAEETCRAIWDWFAS